MSRTPCPFVTLCLPILGCLILSLNSALQAQDKPAQGQNQEPSKMASDAKLATEGKQESAQQTQPADWPYFRGDSASTGVARSTLAQELDVLWEMKVKKGAFEGTASIVSDTADPSRQLVLIGDLDGKLFALNLQTGEKIWEFTTEIGFVTTPVVLDGKVYLGDIDGKFHCLDLQGKEQWSYQADAEINSSANFYKDNVLFGSQDAHLYAVNRDTGKLTWKYQSQDQIRCSITVAEDRAFVAGCDGFFHVVNLGDGTGAGKVEIGSPTGSTPASVGLMVYFGNQTGDFFAINSKDLQTDWVREATNEGDSIVGAAAATEQQVIFGNRNRHVYSLNPKTGDELWKVTLKSKVDSSPVIVGDRVYVASTDGRLYALALKDGAILWERQFNGGFISSPAVAFGRLVIATNRGVVYCLGAKKTDAEQVTPSGDR
jgi:outer membrane protein assembly factor BamB